MDFSCLKTKVIPENSITVMNNMRTSTAKPKFEFPTKGKRMEYTPPYQTESPQLYSFQGLVCCESLLRRAGIMVKCFTICLSLLKIKKRSEFHTEVSSSTLILPFINNFVKRKQFIHLKVEFLLNDQNVIE